MQNNNVNQAEVEIETETEVETGVDTPEMDERSPVTTRIEDLFSLPVEIWDRENQESQNIGGVKFWMVYNYKNPEKQKANRGSPVVFHNPELRNIIKAVPAQFFTLNRAMFNEDGSPIEVARNDGTAGQRREQCGFMLFLTIGTPAIHGQWLEQIQQTLGADYVDSLQNHAQFLVESDVAYIRNGVHYLKGVNTRVNGILTPMRLSACIYFAYTSGGEDDSAVWGYLGQSGDEAAQSSMPIDSVAIPV